MYLVYDTETTGLPDWGQPSDAPQQPYAVDLAATLFDRTGLEVGRFDCIINNPGVIIPDDVAAIHGITTEIAQAEGIDPTDAWDGFIDLLQRADVVVGHNVKFDNRIMRIHAARYLGVKWDCVKPTFCTMMQTTKMVKARKANPRFDTDYKWPNLSEATQHFFGHPHSDAHRARPDADASARIFFHLKEQGLA